MGCLSGGQKVYVEKVYVLSPSPILVKTNFEASKKFEGISKPQALLSQKHGYYLETGIGEVKSPKLRGGGLKMLNFRGSLKFDPFLQRF